MVKQLATNFGFVHHNVMFHKDRNNQSKIPVSDFVTTGFEVNSLVCTITNEMSDEYGKLHF